MLVVAFSPAHHLSIYAKILPLTIDQSARVYGLRLTIRAELDRNHRLEISTKFDMLLGGLVEIVFLHEHDQLVLGVH
jgi:hypothetical protein